MTEAVRGMTAYAVKQLGLLRVFAGVYDSNPASSRVLEKAGYVLKGRTRRSVIKNSVIHDQILYAFVVDGVPNNEES